MGRALFREKLDDFLFSLSFHPSEAFYVKGFADGRVTASSYDYEGKIKTVWTTKRHKGSCRALTYDHEGKCKQSHIFFTFLMLILVIL